MSVPGLCFRLGESTTQPPGWGSKVKPKISYVLHCHIINVIPNLFRNSQLVWDPETSSPHSGT